MAEKQKTEKQTPQTEEDYGQEFEFQYAASDDGVIQIGDDVLARIVEIATGEVDGVSLESKFALSDLINLKDKEAVKGISIGRKEDDSSVNVTVSVRMGYGKDMYDLAMRLRKHVKATVEKMTHVIVRRVDVRIVGIIVDRPGKAPEGTPEDEEQ
ncbi:MAG: hypothetical protein PWP23_961 [Candidatus Sumerlaeota bacterium]|nr:hypothetical protein [Candidatus Sumerlaeota bacterium]